MRRSVKTADEMFAAGLLLLIHVVRWRATAAVKISASSWCRCLFVLV